jgi:GDP-4-dehydro-6-deoxy-D-mannose reductase
MQRDFTDVRDVCCAYSLMLASSIPLDTYNVASGRSTALSEVVEILLGLAACPIVVERDPSLVRREDIDVLSGDASRLEGATGWRPTIELERTLADALEEARRIVRSGEAATA